MVCIRHDDKPIWINVEYLAHRNCDDCIDRWRARGLEYQKIATANRDATLFALMRLPTTDGRGDNAFLHAAELPDTWIDTEEQPMSTPSSQIQDEDDAARLRNEGRSWSLVAQTLGITEDTARLFAAASDRRVDGLHRQQEALFEL